MKTLKAILVGILVWVLGVSVFTLSYFIPVLEDLELQANILLALALIPFAWLGASIYYKNGDLSSGLKVGATMVLTAMVLDAIITVPILIIPYGGSYFGFFTAPSFWAIAAEYFVTIVLFWSLRVKPQINQIGS